jgi:nickel transport protein
MQSKLSWLRILIIIGIVNFPLRVLSHGSNITYQKTDALEIMAKYDNGQPMGNAQVIVYSPDKPTTPWLKGITDEEGKFIFAPDTSIKGNWTVKVRIAGHGSIINIPVEQVTIEPETTSINLETEIKENQSSTSNYNTLQKLMMAATGVWGFVGTAFFFSRKKLE